MEENDKYKLTFTGDNLIRRALCRTEDGPKYKLTDETTNLLGRTLYCIEALKEYFNNTPKEQLEKDWEEIKQYQNIGPTVDEYVEYVKRIKKSIKNK